MSKPIHVQIIEEARALIADKEKWCRRQMALDIDGVPVCANDANARKMCAYGALIAAAHRWTEDSGRAFALTSTAATRFGGSEALIRINDARGHAAVLALFDEAIRRPTISVSVANGAPPLVTV